MAISHFEHVEYRVVVVVPESRKILVRERDGAHYLLRASIDPGARIARQLQEKLRRQWGIATIVLDLLSYGTEGSLCAVAELLTPLSPNRFVGVSLKEIASGDLTDQERAHLLQIFTDSVASPFSRIGWVDEAARWIQDVTGRRVCSKSSLEQYNVGVAFTLVRFSAQDNHAYWLKATGAPNTHERPLTRLLSDLCPGSLPTFVAERPEWNAWLMTASETTELTNSPEDLVQSLGDATRSLARLQMSTVGMERRLLDAGAIDQRLHVLRAGAAALFDFVAEAMSRQASTAVPRIEPDRLHEIRRVFEDVCGQLESLDIPATILHGDMNLGNLIFGEGGCCQLLDWSEGYIGHPFVSLQHLLLLNPLDALDLRMSVNESLKGIYRLAMREICDSQQMEEGFQCMPLLAVASALYGRGDWLRDDSEKTQRRYAYTRNLARHIVRAAGQLG